MTDPQEATQGADAPLLAGARRAALPVIAATCLLAAPTAFALGPGDAAKDFEMPALDGSGTVALAEYRGKVVYLDFWASWCGPCQTAIPLIEELRAEFPPQHFQVVAVNLDKSAKKARKFLEKNPVGYPSAADPRGKLPRAFGLETMPTSYLIDQKGVVRYVHEGFREGDVDAIRAEIKKLLGARVATSK